MTDTAAPDRETLTRASQLFNQDSALHWDDAVAQAAAVLETERAEDAERQAKGKEWSDSMAVLWSCSCCGGNAGPGARDGLCPECRPVVAQLVAKRNAAQQVRGHTRMEWAQAYVDRREQPEAG